MKKITISLSGIAVIAIAFMLYGFISEPKVAYIHVQEVYNNFEYKIELEKKFDLVQSSRKRILDSLEIQINALATNIQNSEVKRETNSLKYQTLIQEYQYKQKMFNEDSDLMMEKFSNQIWTQLNKYSEEFGKKNGYSFIYGANGSGGLMYAEEGLNVTEALKNFVNKRYHGKE